MISIDPIKGKQRNIHNAIMSFLKSQKMSLEIASGEDVRDLGLASGIASNIAETGLRYSRSLHQCPGNRSEVLRFLKHCVDRYGEFFTEQDRNAIIGTLTDHTSPRNHLRIRK